MLENLLAGEVRDLSQEAIQFLVSSLQLAKKLQTAYCRLRTHTYYCPPEQACPSMNARQVRPGRTGIEHLLAGAVRDLSRIGMAG